MIRTDCPHGLAWGSWSRDLAPGGPVAARSGKRQQASQSNSQLRSHMRTDRRVGSAIRSPRISCGRFGCSRLRKGWRHVGSRKTRMKTLFAALALATLIAGPAFVTSADAARRSVPEYDQPRANRDSDGSWRCYPYCPGGTYEGRPVREWLKPDGW
jgi:hypothetical protein